jgi:hypothetical protein
MIEVYRATSKLDQRQCGNCISKSTTVISIKHTVGNTTNSYITLFCDTCLDNLFKQLKVFKAENLAEDIVDAVGDALSVDTGSCGEDHFEAAVTAVKTFLATKKG